MNALEDQNANGIQFLHTASGIPIRNVWLLFLYASELSRFQGHFSAEVEESPDLKSLIARLLCHAVDGRLRRGLGFHHRRREDVLDRVRGRIDVLKSFSQGLFERGKVACRYNDLTLDTPRNRFTRSALIRLSADLGDDQADLARWCRALAGAMLRAGVRDDMPSRAELATDQIARHESDDRLMISLSKAVFDLVLPTESEGLRSLLEASREDVVFHELYEKAVGNFFKVNLSRSDGWDVRSGEMYHWNVECGTSGIDAYMPKMISDIVLKNAREGRKIVIDTKFTKIHSHRYSDKFKSAHIYQMYAYLRSQERADDPLSLTSEGILLYPTVEHEVDETAVIQGHHIRFATVDLAQPSNDIEERLKSIPCLCPWSPMVNSPKRSGKLFRRAPRLEA